MLLACHSSSAHRGVPRMLLNRLSCMCGWRHNLCISFGTLDLIRGTLEASWGSEVAMLQSRQWSLRHAVHAQYQNSQLQSVLL